MAHEVESMFYRGEMPWHGLGNALTDAGLRDWRQACVEAGLDWEVRLEDLMVKGGIAGNTVVDHRAAVRMSDGSVLGVVGPTYTVLQNQEAFAWFEPFLESGMAEFEAAGSLRGGSRIWALARIGLEADIRPEDSVKRYVLLSHAHDGTMCVRVGYTDVRVVCMNTLRAAHDSDGSQLIRIRHTKDVKANLDAVRDIMDLAAAEFRATVEQYRKLQAKDGINVQDVFKYVAKVLDAKTGPDGQYTKRVFDRLEQIVRRAWEGVGNTGGTVWDAFNAVTEWTTWARGRTEESRLNACWFGEGREITDRALRYALRMTDPDWDGTFEPNGKVDQELLDADAA